MFKNLIPVHFMALIVILSAVQGWAWPPTYGAEFELQRAGVKHVIGENGRALFDNENKMKKELADHLKARCRVSGCQIKKVFGKWGEDYKVVFPDGWWIKLSSDPGCVEVMFKPSTLVELESKKNIINDYIFKAGAEIGLKPNKKENTHVNIGVRSAFKDNASDFLRFFVDYANNPHLALGSLGADLNNAPTLSILEESQRDALKEIIIKHENGELDTIQDIAYEIQDKVYTQSYNPSWGGVHHYQALGLKRVNMTELKDEDAPMEFRAVWSQTSAENFNLVARLLEARIKYISQNPGPIIYNAPTNKSYNRRNLKTRFFIYVEETGLKYSDFESLLPKEIRDLPVEDFVNPKATPLAKLKQIEAYWSEILTSKWIRNNVIHILNDPTLSKSPLAEKYRSKIKEMAVKEANVFSSIHQKNKPQTAAQCSKLFH